MSSCTSPSLRAGDPARRGSFALAVIAIVLHAAPALACPVCLGANGQRVLYTYFVTAAVMTLTALGLVGGIAFWLYRRFKQAEMQLSEAEP